MWKRAIERRKKVKEHYNLYYLFLEDKMQNAVSKVVKNKIWNSIKKRLIAGIR